MQMLNRFVLVFICTIGSGCDSATSTDRGSSVAQAGDAAKPDAIKETDKNTKANDRLGDDWPVFLGPHGTGVSDETGLLDEWPAIGPRVLWEKRIGKGYSSPSILGSQVVVHHRQRDRDIVECVNVVDGKPIWKYEYETNYGQWSYSR